MNMNMNIAVGQIYIAAGQIYDVIAHKYEYDNKYQSKHKYRSQ